MLVSDSGISGCCAELEFSRWNTYPVPSNTGLQKHAVCCHFFPDRGSLSSHLVNYTSKTKGKALLEIFSQGWFP